MPCLAIKVKKTNLTGDITLLATLHRKMFSKTNAFCFFTPKAFWGKHCFLIFFNTAVSLFLLDTATRQDTPTSLPIPHVVLILKAYLTFPETKIDARVSQQSVAQNPRGHKDDAEKPRKRQRRGNRGKSVATVRTMNEPANKVESNRRAGKRKKDSWKAEKKQKKTKGWLTWGKNETAAEDVQMGREEDRIVDRERQKEQPHSQSSLLLRFTSLMVWFTGRQY